MGVNFLFLGMGSHAYRLQWEWMALTFWCKKMCIMSANSYMDIHAFETPEITSFVACMWKWHSGWCLNHVVAIGLCRQIRVPTACVWSEREGGRDIMTITPNALSSHMDLWTYSFGSVACSLFTVHAGFRLSFLFGDYFRFFFLAYQWA